MEHDYYDNKANVESYSKFTPSHDGSLLVDALAAWLPEGSSVLELGMGPGKDYRLLSERFSVTGSDFSNTFLQRYSDRINRHRRHHGPPRTHRGPGHAGDHELHRRPPPGRP